MTLDTHAVNLIPHHALSSPAEIVIAESAELLDPTSSENNKISAQNFMFSPEV